MKFRGLKKQEKGSVRDSVFAAIENEFKTKREVAREIDGKWKTVKTYLEQATKYGLVEKKALADGRKTFRLNYGKDFVLSEYKRIHNELRRKAHETKKYPELNIRVCEEEKKESRSGYAYEKVLWAIENKFHTVKGINRITGVKNGTIKPVISKGRKYGLIEMKRSKKRKLFKLTKSADEASEVYSKLDQRESNKYNPTKQQFKSKDKLIEKKGLRVINPDNIQKIICPHCANEVLIAKK